MKRKSTLSTVVNIASDPATGFFYGVIVLIVQVLYVIVPVRTAIENSAASVLSPALALAGAAILLIAFICDRKRFLCREMVIPWLIIAVLLATSAINHERCLTENLKTVIWQTDLLILMFSSCIELGQQDQSSALDNGRSQIIRRAFRYAMLTVMLIWDIAVIVSLVQYYKQLYYEAPDTIGFFRQGLVEGRLFGVFITPYDAALMSLYIAVASIYCFVRERTLQRIFLVITFILSITMIVLSETRSVMLGILVMILIITLMISSDRLPAGISAKGPCASRLLAAVLAAAVTLSAGLLIQGYGKLLKASNAQMNHLQVNHRYDEQDQHTDEQDILERSDTGGDNISNNRFRIWSDYIYVFTHEPQSMMLGFSPCGYMRYIDANYPDLYIVKYYKKHPDYSYLYYQKHQIYAPHNSAISVLISTGLSGFFLLITLAFLLIKKTVNYYLTERFKIGQYCAFAVLVTTAVAIMFEEDIFYICNNVSVVFWMTMGYMFGSTRLTEESEKIVG